MLRVGLTGGIGSGKSTVAQRFRELGAVVIDADQVAREVVTAGSTGLDAIRQRFGAGVTAPDGSLDRAALGEIVFADPQARKDLEAITHPLIRARTRVLMDLAGPQDIVVHEIPLLVELEMAAAYHLTVMVGADEHVRIARLTSRRRLTVADARARIATQASDRQRRAAADVWLDNNGDVEALLLQVDGLWHDRLVPFNDNLVTGARSRPERPALVPYDASWPDSADRLVKRIQLVLGDSVVSVEHIGSTSVSGLDAKDVVDLQIGVRALADADVPEFSRALAGKGFPRSEGNDQDAVHSWAPDRRSWAKRFHGSADPGRTAHVHVREHGSAGYEAALLFRDWLVANPAERDEYAALKLALAPKEDTILSYSVAKEPWIDSALERARVWARHTGWKAD